MAVFDNSIFDSSVFDTGNVIVVPPDPPTPTPTVTRKRGIPINAYKQFKAINKNGEAYYMSGLSRGD